MHQEKIWEIYQNDPELESMGCPSGGRIEFVAKKIPAGAEVLNIGVGQGKLENLLHKKGVKVYSLDPSETSITRIKNELGVGEECAKVGYSQDIPFANETFDIVIMTEVLEHLDDDVIEKTLVEVKRVLKPNGVFVGTVPADEDLSVSVVVCPQCGMKFHRWGHVQSFSEQGLRKVLEREFSDVTVSRKFFVHYPDLNWKGKIASTVKFLQAKLGMAGTNQNFYFEARD